MKAPHALTLTLLVVKPSGAACYEYRAKNSFGAILPGSAVPTSRGRMLTEEQNGNEFMQAWNKEYTVQGGDEISDMVRRLHLI